MANSINVVVVQQKVIKVSTNATSTMLTTSVPVTLKNNPVLSSITVGANSLAQLSDVNTSNQIDGAPLVYNANTEKYVIEPLNVSDLVGNIDFGTF